MVRARDHIAAEVARTSKNSLSGKSGVGVHPTPAFTPIPDDVPFPVDVLPSPRAEFCREGARVLKCDTGLVALPIIGVIAAAVGMTRRIYLGGEWFEPAVFWVCPILESGGMKTPAAELSVSLVKDIQKKHLATYRQEFERYKEELTEYKRSRRNWSDGEGETAEPKRPTLKRVLVADVTLEKLTDIIDDNPRGLLKYSDELAAHFGSFTKYKSGGGSDEANWLSIFRADAIVYDRKTGEKTSVFVPHAAVSIVGGIQPGVMKRLITKGMFDSGTMPRFVFRLAARTPKEYVEEGINAEAKEKVVRSLNMLYALHQPDTDEDGLHKPKVVKLADDARRRWKKFVNDWGKKQFDTDGELAAALSKLEGMAARFALIHHLVTAGEWADTSPVRLMSVQAGIRFMEWAANETVRVYRTLNESEDAADTRKLAELVGRLAKKSQDGDRVTGRELQRSRGEKYPTTEAAEVALDALVGAGVGRWEEGIGKPGRGGKVSRTFVLNPTPDMPDMPDDGGGRGEPDKVPDMPAVAGEAGDTIAVENHCDSGTSDESSDAMLSGMSGMSGVGLESERAEDDVVGDHADGGLSGGHVGSVPMGKQLADALEKATTAVNGIDVKKMFPATNGKATAKSVWDNPTRMLDLTEAAGKTWEDVIAWVNMGRARATCTSPTPRSTRC